MASNEFVDLANYLKRNFISCAYSDYGTNLWIFEYREKENSDYDDSRDIIVLANESLVPNLDSVIDKKEKMYLIVGKGANVR